jgi:methylated-DNA-[protein]-cysteine S-methyltransferase
MIFETPAGWIGLLGSDRGLSKTTLPQKTKELAGLALGRKLMDPTYLPQFFAEVVDQIEAYFKGRLTDFRITLDLSGATAFEKQVWEATRTIPYGRTQSYRWVAQRIGKPLSSRAVGGALGRNPVPIIIPCHRVIGSDGNLRGFGGGLDMKRYLLDLESRYLSKKNKKRA